MTPPEIDNPWKRVGPLLAKRRENLGERYKNKTLFSRERGLERRMVWSVETGERDNYTDTTKQQVEHAYMLVPGSLSRTLATADGPLETLPGSPPDAAALSGELDDDAARKFPGDDMAQSLWRAPGTLDDKERRIADLYELRRKARKLDSLTEGTA